MTRPTDHPTNIDPDRAARIAAANDAFRKTANSGVVFTATLAAEGLVTMLAILAKVRAYDAFTPDNDPYGEHEFGSITHALSLGGNPRTETCFWKIDTYADAALAFGAEDPLDANAVRILTIMHASDY